MKTLIINIILISLICFLISCEKNDDLPENIPELSIDSLEILQTNIPGGHYTDLTFVNENTGFAVSNAGAIVKTTDGGYDWEQILSPADFFLSKIQFSDSQTGYIIGGDETGGYLLKSTDAGQTWQKINLQTIDNERPTGLFFLNNSVGFISGKKLFRKTTDGGLTWTDVMGPISENINDAGFRNGMEGYATSDSGKYFKTVNGGATWQAMQSNTGNHLKKIYFTELRSYAKCSNSVFIDLLNGDICFTASDSAFKYLFLDDSRCIGIGQHYEGGFLPYGDIFLTNDAWSTFSQRKFSPQSEALNVTAIAKAKEGKIIIIGSGTINTSVIELRY